MKDKRAKTKWDKSNISYLNYIKYIASKTNKFNLSIIDLFYIKNFKGGSATINEKEDKVYEKLPKYSELLERIDKKLSGKKLNELNDSEEAELIEFAKEGIDLVNRKNATKIDGFSTSFLTTLLHFYFPNLFPILDRRVLNGLKLIDKSDVNSVGQVKKIELFYPKLIKGFKVKMSDKKSIRELDKELFTEELNFKKN